jgi:GT2 family glycosyltransferase
MRILAHVFSMNDAAVIDYLIEALRRQSRPLDAILIVDNASTDGTLDKTFPDNVTIIRNSENLGTAGAARIGFAYALEHGFDWIWLLDPDSGPEPDALERLLAFFERLPPEQQEQVCFLASRPLTETGEIKQQPIVFEGPRAMTEVPIASTEGFTRCDCTLWSGSLYRTAAIARVGLPSADFFTDSEVEYGYRARQLGLTSYVVHDSVTRHDVGRNAGATTRRFRLGPVSLVLVETSPLRSYYGVRDSLYLLIYVCRPRRMSVVWRAIKMALAITAGFAVRPFSHRPQFVACIRGIRDGLTGHMERRY